MQFILEFIKGGYHIMRGSIRKLFFKGIPSKSDHLILKLISKIICFKVFSGWGNKRNIGRKSI
jgi:hypothetical protein